MARPYPIYPLPTITEEELEEGLEEKQLEMELHQLLNPPDPLAGFYPMGRRQGKSKRLKTHHVVQSPSTPTKAEDSEERLLELGILKWELALSEWRWKIPRSQWMQNGWQDRVCTIAEEEECTDLAERFHKRRLDDVRSANRHYRWARSYNEEWVLGEVQDSNDLMDSLLEYQRTIMPYYRSVSVLVRAYRLGLSEYDPIGTRQRCHALWDEWQLEWNIWTECRRLHAANTGRS